VTSQQPGYLLRTRSKDLALRRSVGFGPAFFPRASRGPTRCPPPSSAGRAVPVGAARRGGSHASDARRRPVPTPPSVASTCCLSRIPLLAVTSARQPAAQHKQDAGEHRALGDPRPSAAAPRTATGLRKQRLETRPQRIVQEGLCHARPYQVDRASTRDQSETRSKETQKRCYPKLTRQAFVFADLLRRRTLQNQERATQEKLEQNHQTKSTDSSGCAAKPSRDRVDNGRRLAAR
jgi:hypothetical protein